MPQKAPSQKSDIALSRCEKTSHSRGLRKSLKASSSPKLLLSFIAQVYKLVLYFCPAAPMFPVHLIMSQPGLSTCSICTFSPAPNFIVTLHWPPMQALQIFVSLSLTLIPPPLDLSYSSTRYILLQQISVFSNLLLGLTGCCGPYSTQYPLMKPLLIMKITTSSTIDPNKPCCS